MSKIKRIALWSGPRNISTALMYSFAQRSDTKVFDEPLYAYYLKNTEAKNYHPEAEAILASMEQSGEIVVEQMLAENAKPVLFFKNMCHHLLDLDKTFTKQMTNVILTRHPKEMIPSFAKVISNPKLIDIAYKTQADLLQYFKTKDINYVVLDSKNVLQNPETVLRQFCDKIEIPFDDNMLKWEAQKRPEDGIWAPYFYTSVHESTGFMPYKPKTEAFPKDLEPLLNEALPYYKLLEAEALG